MIQTRICRQCSCSFIGGPRAYFCVKCRLERRKEQSKEYKIRKKSGEIRPHGSTDICERCGKEYTVVASLQRFCTNCQIPHTLEYDRTTGLDYYHDNKIRTNPPRNEKRRTGIQKCLWCGKEFDTHTSQLTCSLECRKKRKNARWVQRYKKNKKKKEI